MALLVAIVLAGLLIGVALPARVVWTDEAEQCIKEKTNLDLVIHYCTKAIQSGQLSNEELVSTFGARGNAYERNGEHD